MKLIRHASNSRKLFLSISDKRAIDPAFGNSENSAEGLRDNASLIKFLRDDVNQN